MLMSTMSSKASQVGQERSRRSCKKDTCVSILRLGVSRVVLLLVKPAEKFTSTQRQFLTIVFLLSYRKLAIISGWLLFVYVAYKTTQYDYEYANFDPYEILQVEVGASPAAVKSAYRKLSVIYHPDKPTGDEKSFMKITKAYQV